MPLNHRKMARSRKMICLSPSRRASDWLSVALGDTRVSAQKTGLKLKPRANRKQVVPCGCKPWCNSGVRWMPVELPCHSCPTYSPIQRICIPYFTPTKRLHGHLTGARFQATFSTHDSLRARTVHCILEASALQQPSKTGFS